MKYWEATIANTIIVSPTLKGLAAKLHVKPSQIEGVYYRKRLNDLIKIKKLLLRLQNLFSRLMFPATFLSALIRWKTKLPHNAIARLINVKMLERGTMKLRARKHRIAII